MVVRGYLWPFEGYLRLRIAIESRGDAGVAGRRRLRDSFGMRSRSVTGRQRSGRSFMPDREAFAVADQPPLEALR